ncbi:hypothetical protein OH76DRAFT_103193 [Lentinus brumalis]|uniref:Uncharacterized protein n=1 Tax=Lentinus brumalis TaxID=2498619 RepID=A0A371CQ87_9APHY|nr:hypothetical protein OH76DRAFT_103193 [Polyporus brumalis]
MTQAGPASVAHTLAAVQVTNTEEGVIRLRKHMARPPGCTFLGAKATSLPVRLGCSREHSGRTSSSTWTEDSACTSNRERNDHWLRPTRRLLRYGRRTSQDER